MHNNDDYNEYMREVYDAQHAAAASAQGAAEAENAPPQEMTDRELAGLFCTRASLAADLADIDAVIKREVLRRGETVKIAGVTATYYKESQKRDHEGAAIAHALDHDIAEIIQKHTTTKLTTAWAKVCEDASIDVPVTETKAPRVAIK